MIEGSKRGCLIKEIWAKECKILEVIGQTLLSMTRIMMILKVDTVTLILMNIITGLMETLNLDDILVNNSIKWAESFKELHETRTKRFKVNEGRLDNTFLRFKIDDIRKKISLVSSNGYFLGPFVGAIMASIIVLL